jgi:glutamate receptor, ionotropic, invertebrate
MSERHKEKDNFIHFQVLEWPVWLCILGAYLFTSSLLWIFDKFSPYSYTNNKQKYENDMEKREFTLKECLWFCMTSLTPQGLIHVCKFWQQKTI